MNRRSIQPEDVTVVVRTVGERTTQACRALLALQVPRGNIFELEGRPFATTLKLSYELGLRETRPWMLCVDADVLPASDAVQRFLTEAATLPPEYCELEGVVLDRYFGGPRPAGNHLYRTSFLGEALALLAGVAHEIRPEAATIRRMTERGHPWRHVSQVFGLHDFEQGERDVFRKCFVHAHKHAECIPALLAIWRRRAPHESDFAVALRGLAAGIAAPSEARVDVADPVVDKFWRALGSSKEAPGVPPPFTVDAATVDRWIATFKDEPEFNTMFPHGFGQRARPSWRMRFRALRTQLGTGRALLWMGGSVALRAGNSLRRLAGPAKPL